LAQTDVETNFERHVPSAVAQTDVKQTLKDLLVSDTQSE
jgi:hypothetical protein